MSGDGGARWKSVARGRGFRVQAVARSRREDPIARVEDAVQRHRGDFLVFKMFSSLSLSLIVETMGTEVMAFADELLGIGWHVDLDPARDVLAASPAEPLEGTVQVTFPDGDGNLVIPVPAVPG
jgi:hypothetical protein